MDCVQWHTQSIQESWKLIFTVFLLFLDLVCNCDAEGTARDICDPNTGVCICMKNYAGPRCDVCNEGYYNFPRCSGNLYMCVITKLKGLADDSRLHTANKQTWKRAGRLFQVVRHCRQIWHNPFNPAALWPVFSHDGYSFGIIVLLFSTYWIIIISHHTPRYLTKTTWKCWLLQPCALLLVCVFKVLLR